MKVAIEIEEELIEQVKHFYNVFPNAQFYIDSSRISLVADFLNQFEKKFQDFETENTGSRGISYIKAQENILVRQTGIENLFKILSSKQKLKSSFKILDLLGGNGLISKVSQEIFNDQIRPTVITSDISRGMVQDALKSNIPALRQPAQKLLFNDNSIEAILLAYGTHHIPVNQREDTICESKRVLVKGGKLIVHDFEVNSPVAKWFTDIVHVYSETGHDFAHFSKEELINYFKNNNFSKFNVDYIYDPFIFKGLSINEVESKLVSYLYNMYGLIKLDDVFESSQERDEFIYRKAQEIFKYDFNELNLPENFGVNKLTITESNGKWALEMPRIALVGIAEK